MAGAWLRVSGSACHGATRHIRVFGLLVLLVGCASVSGYRVEPGDTLYGISWKYGLDHRDVARWNNLAPPYRIFPGQTLELSAPRETEWTLLSKSSTASVPVVAARGESPSNVQTQGMVREQPPRSVARPSSAVAKPAVSAPVHWRWPTQGPVTLRKKDGLVVGVDIGGGEGQPVHAAAAGRVVYSGDGLKGYGNLVIIKHDDEFFSAYAHNRRLLVRDDQHVTGGQRIAEIGHDRNQRPSLYFEIRRNGKPVDPRRYLSTTKH